MLTRDVSSACATRIINYVDVLAHGHSLVREDIPLDTQLGDLGIGPQKCGILERKINAERVAHGKEALEGGTIKVTTTVAEVVGYACN